MQLYLNPARLRQQVRTRSLDASLVYVSKWRLYYLPRRLIKSTLDDVARHAAGRESRCPRIVSTRSWKFAANFISGEFCYLTCKYIVRAVRSATATRDHGGSRGPTDGRLSRVPRRDIATDLQCLAPERSSPGARNRLFLQMLRHATFRLVLQESRWYSRHAKMLYIIYYSLICDESICSIA